MSKKPEVLNLAPELDYLTVTGSTTKINLDSDLHKGNLRAYFVIKHGFKKSISGGKRATLVFESPKHMRKIFISFRKKGGGKKGTMIMMDFPGSYLYGGESQERINEVKNFAERVFKDLKMESGPHFSQVDIQIDRLGASFQSHGTPLHTGEYKLQHVTRGDIWHKVQPHFNDPKDKTKQTGQEVKCNKNSRVTYSRQFALTQKYSTPDYKYYKKYYDELYQGHKSILREELKFKKGSLEHFNTSFWGLNRPVRIIMKEMLSRYNEQYKYIDTETGKAVEDLEKLFGFGKFKSRKELFNELGMEPPKGELRLSDTTRDPRYFFKQLAAYCLENKNVSSKDFLLFAFQLRKDIPRIIDQEVENLINRKKAKKSIRPKEEWEDIDKYYDQLIEQALEQKKRFPENLTIIKQELREALDGLTDLEAFLR
jgi:hypothetical protein